MIIFAMLSSAITALMYVIKTWPEELYYTLDNHLK